ncbi:MAG: hypothetical protein ACC645_13170 [Pirellulales bacterium]
MADAARIPIAQGRHHRLRRIAETAAGQVGGRRSAGVIAPAAGGASNFASTFPRLSTTA